MKKINLGCGPVGKDDWINVDWGILAVLHKFPVILGLFSRLKLIPRAYLVKWPKNLKLHDCRRRLPFASDSVDFIYTSHFLEHLKKFDVERLLKDCFRALKKGGTLRVVVPNLEILLKKYIERDRDFFIKNFEISKDRKDVLLADLLMDVFYPEYHKQKASGSGRLMNWFIRPHLWMYDKESMFSMLKAAGFKQMEQKSYRAGELPDLEALDSLPELSLYIEARK